MKLPSVSPYYLEIFNFYCASGWTTCRETHLINNEGNNFYFYSLNSRACVKRIKRLERRMGIKSPAIFTNKNKNVVHVKLGRFWSANCVRWAVFSAVLKDKRKHYFNEDMKGFLNLFIKGYSKPKLYMHNSEVLDTIIGYAEEGTLKQALRK